MAYSSWKWSRSNKDNIICRINQKWLWYLGSLLFKRRPFASKLEAIKVCLRFRPSEPVNSILHERHKKECIINSIKNCFVRLFKSCVSLPFGNLSGDRINRYYPRSFFLTWTRSVSLPFGPMFWSQISAFMLFVIWQANESKPCASRKHFRVCKNERRRM